MCELCGRDLHADARAYLCPGCTRGTDERLDALPGLYDELAAHLPRGQRTTGPTASGGRHEAPMPVSENVLTLRGPGGILGIVEDWREALHADLGWTRPEPRGTFEERLVASVAGLRVNLLWIASSWPAAGAFAEEIRDLVDSVRSIVDPPERTIRIGHCPAVHEDGAQCGSPLRALPGDAEIRCRWCGAVYLESTWLSLRAAQDTITVKEVSSCPIAS